MTIRLSVPFALLALCCAGPAFAAAGETTARNAEARDSDTEVVCRVQREIGSRLATKKVCLTRAQWRLHRQEQSEQIDRSQRQLGNQNGG